MRLGRLSGLVLLATGIAMASPIFVTNFSFETLPAGGLPVACTGMVCSYSNGPIQGWTESSLTTITGQLQPGSAGLFTTIPDGVTIAYTSGGMISQTVAPLVQLGVTYTLQVDVGLRATYSLGTVDLMIGGTSIRATGFAPTAGNFSTYTAIYTGLAADVGKTIGIRLSATQNQGDFDNVRLSDSTAIAAPEPGTALLGVLGLAAILPVVRRRLHRRG